MTALVPSSFPTAAVTTGFKTKAYIREIFKGRGELATALVPSSFPAVAVITGLKRRL